MGSLQFSRSVMSNSLQPHEPQHTRPPCPSPTAWVYAKPCPLSQWCHPTISSSVIPFSFCPQSFPVSGSFPMSQLFAWGSQSTGVAALASFFPKNTQSWSPLEWTGWISLQSKGLSRVFSNTTVQKHQFFGTDSSNSSWLNGKEYFCQCKRHGFDSWVEKIPWRSKWKPNPVFLSGKSHRHRSLGGCCPWGSKRVGCDLAMEQ